MTGSRRSGLVISALVPSSSIGSVLRGPGPFGWACWALTCAVTFTLTSLAVWIWYTGYERLRVSVARLEAAHVVPEPAAQPATAYTTADFTFALPAQPPTVEDVAALLERACKASGAALVELSSTESAATTMDLGRRDVQVDILGPYPSVKQVLGRVLREQPASAVTAMRLQADDESPGVRARLTLAFWSRSTGIDGVRPAAIGPHPAGR